MSKSKFILFIAISTIILTAVYWLTREPKQNKQSTSLKKSEVTHSKKLHKNQPEVKELKQASTAPVKNRKRSHKDAIEERLKQIRSLAHSEKPIEQQPISSFINKTGESYSWSTKIFAVLKFVYDGNPNEIVGRIGNMVLIPASRKPRDSFYVVKSHSSGEIGYYTGQIIIVTNDKKIENYLNQNSTAWNSMAGAYFIASPDIETALSTVQKLRANFPHATIDIDFNINNAVAN